MDWVILSNDAMNICFIKSNEIFMVDFDKRIQTPIKQND